MNNIQGEASSSREEEATCTNFEIGAIVAATIKMDEVILDL